MTGDEDQKWLQTYYSETITRKVFDWLVELTYWYGWQRGYAARQEKKPDGSEFYLSGWEAHPHKLEFRWYIAYGHFYLIIKDREADSLSQIWEGGKPIDEVVVLSRKDRNELDAQAGEQLAQSLEELVKRFFRGIRQVNGVRICTSPAHNPPRQPETAGLLSRPYISVCEQIGDRWLCEWCRDCFGLGQDQIPVEAVSLKKHQKEMEKLTPACRLTVLERDGFACEACGRSPALENEVRLRVMHVIPVIEGGKTTLENLTTRCQECANILRKSSTR